MEDEVWTGHVDRLGGEAVQQIRSSVEPFYPVASRNRSPKKQGTQHIIVVRMMRLGLLFYGEV
jgi:hypothetical protein